MMPSHPTAARRQPLARSPFTAALAVIGIGIALAGLVVGITGRGDRTPAVAEAPPATEPGRLAELESRVADDPEDAAAWAELGAAYVDHARVESEPSAYPKAEQALDRSLAIEPDGNWQALAAHGALAAGRHDFGTALDFADRALAMQPQSSFILGIVVDSLTELGRYPEAVEAAQEMVDLRPDLASYARVSYQRELHGDLDGAIVAMEDALRAASTAGDRSFALYFLGELEWQRGRIDAAEARYVDAVSADPTAMQAVAGLGKVAAARGELDVALARYEQAVEGFPDPEVLKELGELYLLAGRDDLAEAAFDRSHEENAKQAAGGVDINLEIALFSADHRRDLDAGVEAALREWDLRQSIHVADALAWQLHAHDRYEEALTYADKALQLGTRNASFFFHRAEIHRALGDRDAARADYTTAVQLNPNFSFLHREAADRGAAGRW